MRGSEIEPRLTRTTAAGIKWREKLASRTGPVSLPVRS
jgi:hypothetical protein